MTDKTDIAALRPSERAKLGFVTDDNTGGYYVAECEECGKIFPSQNCDGGGQIADTGDYGDCYCPHCGHVDPEVCENANLVWNVQQLKIISLTSQLEAERQRADKAELELIQPLPIGELIQRLEGQTHERWFSLSDLKGEQVPVAWKINSDIPCHNVVTVSEVVAKSWIEKGRSVMPLYDRPQKPVISKEKLCDWLEDNFDIDDSQRDAFANYFAHHCKCIVKKEDE